MTCDRALRLVEKLADGEASASEQLEAEAHLETCEDCRSHFRFVRALDSASANIDWPEPPEAYWHHLPSKVLARIESEPGDERSFWGKLLGPAVLRFGAVAATLTVVVVVGFSVLRDDPGQMKPELAARSSGETVGERDADEPRDAVSPETEPQALADIPSAGAASVPAAEEEVAESEPALEPPVPAAPRLSEPAPVDRDDVLGFEAAGAESRFASTPSAAPPSDRESRAQRSVAEAPGEAGRPVEAAVLQSTSEARLASDEAVRKESPARARFVGETCEQARAYLARYGDDGNESVEARYRAAMCSIDEYRAAPGDETLEQALRDSDAFLALESEGERADELRRRAEEIKR